MKFKHHLGNFSSTRLPYLVSLSTSNQLNYKLNKLALQAYECFIQDTFSNCKHILFKEGYLWLKLSLSQKLHVNHNFNYIVKCQHVTIKNTSKDLHEYVQLINKINLR